MPLSSDEQIVVGYWEQEWFTHSKLPSKADTLKVTGLSPQTLSAVLKSPRFAEALSNRGINTEPTAKLLTPEQIAAANSLLDIADHRSLPSKLKSLGITPRQYSAWQKQAAFREYLQRRAEDLFSDVLPEAHSALAKNVQNGDLNSIKLFYEISGRWNPKSQTEVNVEILMMRIIDILTRHLAAQPKLLKAIAEELSLGTNIPLNSNPSPVVKGEIEDGGSWPNSS